MQPPPPPGMDTVSTVPMANVATPPGMMTAPWIEAPRQGSAVILVMFTAVALLMLAGAVVLHARVLVEQPQNWGSPEWLEWRRTTRLMAFVGALLLHAGVFLSLVFGVFVAVRRPDLPEIVRRAMLVGPAILVGVWLVVVFLFSGLLSLTP